MADLVFYTNPMSRGQTARWMLEEVGEPYDTEILDYGSTMKAGPWTALELLFPPWPGQLLKPEVLEPPLLLLLPPPDEDDDALPVELSSSQAMTSASAPKVRPAIMIMRDVMGSSVE